MYYANENTALSFDYTSLDHLIALKFGKEEFSKLMSIRLSKLDSLLSGEREFSQSEIIRAAALLDLRANEVSVHFFTPKV